MFLMQHPQGVGGIHANYEYGGEFIYENTLIQTNLIHNAYLYGVRKFLFLDLFASIQNLLLSL